MRRIAELNSPKAALTELCTWLAIAGTIFVAIWIM